VHDEAAVAVEDAAQEEEGPADFEMGDIDVPVLVGPQGLLEALPLAGWRPTRGANLPAALSTRETLEGLTATMSASSIM
jgi:hypothetical protein